MRAVVQRVSNATLSVEGKAVSAIEKGLVVYFGVQAGDTVEQAKYLAKKIVNMRIFADDNGKMNLSALQCGYSILLVSQFTLLADTSHGNRPDFLKAEKPDLAQQMYLQFATLLEQEGIKPQLGVFGADMTIQQTNCGPVTIVMDK